MKKFITSALIFLTASTSMANSTDQKVYINSKDVIELQDECYTDYVAIPIFEKIFNVTPFRNMTGGKSASFRGNSVVQWRNRKVFNHKSMKVRFYQSVDFSDTISVVVNNVKNFTSNPYISRRISELYFASKVPSIKLGSESVDEIDDLGNFANRTIKYYIDGISHTEGPVENFLVNRYTNVPLTEISYNRDELINCLTTKMNKLIDEVQ